LGVGCNLDAMTRKIVSAAKDENIKIVTINYPKIVTNRIPVDNLAIETVGKSFTILETKQNEQQNLLSTFFELTKTFFIFNAIRKNYRRFFFINRKILSNSYYYGHVKAVECHF
jgi:hypothetical protein